RSTRSRSPIGAIERHDGARGRGVLGELARIGERDRVLLEERVAEDLLQVGGEARRAVVGERRDVDAEDLGELDEQVRRQRPLVVLDEIEVAAGDVELAGQIRLTDALAAAEGPNFGTESEVAHESPRAHAVRPYRCKFTTIHKFSILSQ